jgi:hypothetical protein
LLVGLPALRLSGLYLALITFGIAVSFPQLPKKFDHLFGGTTGKILNLAKPPFGLSTTTNNWMYYLTWGIALVLLVAAWLLVGSKAARAQAGATVRWRPRQASASAGTRQWPSGSPFYAGGGLLYAIANAYVNPDVPDHPSVSSRGFAVGGSTPHGADRGGLIYFLRNHADSVAGRSTIYRRSISARNAGHPEHGLRRRVDHRHVLTPNGRRLITSRIRR